MEPRDIREGRWERSGIVNVPWTNRHDLNALELVRLGHTLDEADNRMLGGRVQRRRIHAHQARHRRDHQHHPLLVCPQQRSHRDPCQLDRVVDVDLHFRVPVRFGVVPEIGPFLSWRHRSQPIIPKTRSPSRGAQSEHWDPEWRRKEEGVKYGLKDPSARDVDVRHVAEFLLRDGNEVLEVGPLRDVAFGEDDV